MNNEEKILAMLEQMRTDISDLKQGQTATNSRLDTIEGNQDALSADVTRLNHTIEPQLKLIQEGIEGLQERYDRLDKVEAKQEDHGHRIWALEQARKAQ